MQCKGKRKDRKAAHRGRRIEKQPPVPRLVESFYTSEEWRRVRYSAIRSNDGRCECCGDRPTPGNPLHVDHIKPRSKFPDLALERDNLQVLCANCNLGKGNTDAIDWRRA